jgi:branched-chain amino acid transport system permease protein
MSYVVQGIFLGSTYALVAVGIVIIYNTLHVFQFAQGAVTMLCAYVFLLAYDHFNGSRLIAALVLVGFIIVFSLLLSRFLFEPLLGRHLPSLIVALGLIIVIQEVASTRFYAGAPVAFPASMNITGVSRVGGVFIEHSKLLVFCVSTALILMLDLFFKKSRAGMQMRALADSLVGAELCGIATRKLIRLAFVVAGLTAAVAGVLLGMLQGSVDPTLGVKLTIAVLAAVLVGGPTHFWRVVAASLGIALSQTLSIGYLSSGYSNVVAYVAIILMLVLFPNRSSEMTEEAVV